MGKFLKSFKVENTCDLTVGQMGSTIVKTGVIVAGSVGVAMLIINVVEGIVGGITNLMSGSEFDDEFDEEESSYADEVKLSNVSKDLTK